jgi:DNA-binding NarL/FixJ family response regulator
MDDHPWFRASARALLDAEGVGILGEAAGGETAVDHARRA